MTAALECVVNISEGRRRDVVGLVASCAGPSLLDVHSDDRHNRSVITLGGAEVERAARAVAAEAVRRIDVRAHSGVHPRLGALDVVPFVPLPPPDGPGAGGPGAGDRGAGGRGAGGKVDLAPAIGARDRFAAWAASELGLPCFLYGPGRSLPEIRRLAFGDLPPDAGPQQPHPSAGACCVGARGLLVAYNLWLAAVDMATARSIAAALRSRTVRALAFDLDGTAQLSFNLLDPLAHGPEEVYDAVAALAPIARAELVGLAPADVLAKTPPGRWAELDLDPTRTIESRLAAAAAAAGGQDAAGAPA